LGPGNSGSAVRQLQNVLTICYGLETGGHDGIYGSGTRQDVRTVQSRAGITADGLYGPNTRNIFKWRWYSTGSGTATCARL
jgi:peptidoglycan hydrolase-like protein with peptidoglycan-binding domain